MRFAHIVEAVGRTPLVRLRHASEATGALVLGKLEMRSPGGSVKDRAARAMLRTLLQEGRLGPGGGVVVASAGNMGISVALMGRALQVPAVVVVPSGTGREYRRLLVGLGAQVVLAEGEAGMAGAVRRAHEEARRRPGYVYLSSFDDASAVRAYEDMGREILEDTQGKVDVFVAGVGTSATFTGVARILRSHRQGVRCVAVQPARAPNLTGGPLRATQIYGLGAGFVPPHWQPELADEVVSVEDEDAIAQAHHLWTREGLLVGLSSGAAVHAAMAVVRPGETAVVVLPDGAERYLSRSGFPLPPPRAVRPTAALEGHGGPKAG